MRFVKCRSIVSMVFGLTRFYCTTPRDRSDVVFAETMAIFLPIAITLDEPEPPPSRKRAQFQQ